MSGLRSVAAQASGARAARPTCAVCDAPRRADAPRDLPLCPRAECRWTWVSTPAWRRCTRCEALLRPGDAAPGICHRQACRDGWLRDVAETVDRRRAERIVGITRDCIEAARGRRRATLPVVITPVNTKPVIRLTAAKRRAFLANLDQALQWPADRLAEAPVHDIERRPDDPTPLAPDLAHRFGQACATCRGACCGAGGEHAFLDANALAQVRARDGAPPDDEALRTAYASHLPARHYRNGCVYQTRRGCALPRPLRAPICNNFECSGLREIRQVVRRHEGPIAVAASAGDDPVRVAIVGGERPDPVRVLDEDTRLAWLASRGHQPGPPDPPTSPESAPRA